MIYKLYIYLIFFCLSAVSTYGQQVAKDTIAYSAKSMAQTSIRNLKNGTLVILLTSHKNKLEYLKSKKAVTAVTDIETERDSINKKMIAAFNANITFCKIVYAYDYLLPELVAGNTKSMALDDNLNPTDMPNGVLPTLFLRKDELNSGLSAFIFLDPRGQNMQRPFPYYVKVNSLLKVITSIIPSKDGVARDFSKTAKKMEKNLTKYYKKNVAAN